MDLKMQLLESFAARGSDGKDYKVCAYERLVEDPTLSDGQPHWQSTGVAEVRLADGDPVAVAADGAMRVTRTGITLNRS